MNRFPFDFDRLYLNFAYTSRSFLNFEQQALEKGAGRTTFTLTVQVFASQY